MIVRRLEDGWTLIRQMDHAAHCGEIARAWRAGPFGAGAVSPALEKAATTHDLGWDEVDGEPEVTADGAPVNFTQFEETRHARFYANAVRTIAKSDLHAAYLVSLHASGLYSGRYGWSGFRKFDFSGVGEPGRRLLKGERELRAGAVHSIEAPAMEFDQVWRDYMLLQAFDIMSLLTCFGLPSERLGPVPSHPGQFIDVAVSRLGPWEVRLDPFPFAGDVLEVEVKLRHVPAERFVDAQDLRSQLGGVAFETRKTRYVR